MKFLCKTQDFLSALHLVSRAIGGQQALPILGNILLVAEGKRCTVSATDLELSIITSFEATIENEGSITVPAKAIVNFAQYNSDAEVQLETIEGTQLKCSSKHAKTVIAGEGAADYPTITPIEKETAFTLEAAPLLTALNLVTFASAKTTLRPVLSGVYVRTEKGHLILVATDSYRLSEYRLPIEGGETEISCIIPSKVLEELKAALAGNKSEKPEGEEKKVPAKLEVVLSKQQVEMRLGSTRLLSRLIEGKFPDYQQIIPKEKKTSVAITLRDLSTVVKRMHYFAKETNNNLTFRFADGAAAISTPQTQFGRDEATLGVEITGEHNKIALSSSYLLDFLSHISEPTIVMELTDNMHPAVFRLPSDPKFLHLVMPLRMQD